MPVTEGGCQCGQVRYQIARSPLKGYACHCLECQRQSASAFGLSIPVRTSEITISGTLHDWQRPTDSGTVTTCRYCPDCGVRIVHASARSPEALTVKGGTLDDHTRFVLCGHIWVARKHPATFLDPALPQYELQPDNLGEWREQMMADGQI